MAGGKWISDLTAATPPADAARHVLTVRFRAVRDHLPAAIHQSDEDPEHVHQLRVATRRAGAALAIFAGCLPPRAARAAKKSLRRLRRAAGEARDWDVFLMHLRDWRRDATPAQAAGFDFLAGLAFARREQAQVVLAEAGRGQPAAFDRLAAETVAAVHRPGDQELRALIDLARPSLGSLVQALERAADEDLHDYDHLHQVRILGKRLRYAMEVFADCFAAPFREELYPAVEEMQEILGRANDSHVTARRLAELRDRLRALTPDDWPRFQPGIDGLLYRHRDLLPRERQQFVEWWARWQLSGGEKALAALLCRPEEAPAAPGAPA